MGVRTLTVFSALLTVSLGSYLPAKHIPTNTTYRTACLKVSDEILVLYSSMGCHVTYPETASGCAAVTQCPSEMPKDEKLSALWYAWNVLIEEEKTASEQEGPLKSKVSIRETKTTNESTTAVPATETTSAIARVTRRRDCLRYRRSAINLYKEMGCTITPSRGCTVINDCPSDCFDESGLDHKLHSDTWYEGEKQCSCENIRSVRSFLPRIPRGAPKFPPYKYCVTYGCILPENDQYIKPNEQVQRGNDIECVCREGTGPLVQDDAPPFHLDCVKVR